MRDATVSWRRRHTWLLTLLGASACASTVSNAVGDAAGDERIAADLPASRADVPSVEVGPTDAGVDTPGDLGMDAARDAGRVGPAEVQLTFGERTILGAALAVGEADYGVLWTESEGAAVRVRFMRVGFDGARAEPTTLDDWPTGSAEAVESGGMERSLAARGEGYVMAWLHSGQVRVTSSPSMGDPSPVVFAAPTVEPTRLFVDVIPGSTIVWSCPYGGGCERGVVGDGDAGLTLSPFVPFERGVIVAERTLFFGGSSFFRANPATEDVTWLYAPDAGAPGPLGDLFLPRVEGTYAAGEASPQMRVVSRAVEGNARRRHPYVANVFIGPSASVAASAPPEADAWNRLATSIATATSGPLAFAVGWFTFLGRGGYNGLPYLMTGSISLPVRDVRACPLTTPGLIPEANLTVIRPAWNARRERWVVLWQDARERPSYPESVMRPRTQLFLREVDPADCPTVDAGPAP